MSKLVFLIDYPRTDYLVNGKLDYGASAEGKRLKSELAAMGLRENINYVFYYTYNKIPDPDKETNWGKIISYKTPKTSELKLSYPITLRAINKYKPDLIIPMGTLGSRWTTGKGITSVQGVPSKEEISAEGVPTYTSWVLPIFNQAYVEAQPNNKIQRDLAMVVLRKYLEQGESAIIPERPHYYWIKNMQQARELLAMPIYTGELAWDLETSTLEPNSKGAHVLIFSFAWKEGHAAALPLEHYQVYRKEGTTIEGKPNQWSEADLEELHEIIRNLLEARTVGEINPRAYPAKVSPLPDSTPFTKVGHNIKFDEHFLLATGVIDHVNNVLDTLVGYYLEVSQDKTSSKHLSDLAYTMTTIGGYDEPLEEYKVWLKEVVRSACQVLKSKIGTGNNKNSDYQLTLNSDREDLEEGIDWSYLQKYNFDTPYIREWVLKIVTIPLVNKYRAISKINLSQLFTYEWIPMEIMYYYAAGDGDATLRIHHKLLDMIKEDPRNSNGKMMYLYTKWYPRLVFALANIQNTGIMVDQDYIHSLQEEYNKEKEHILSEIRSIPEVKDITAEKEEEYQRGLAEFAKPVKERDKSIVRFRDKYKTKGTDFSPSSLEDVPKLLYRDLGYRPTYDKTNLKKSAVDKRIPEDKLTWKDYSTSAATIEEIGKQAEEAKDTNIIKLCSLLTQYSKVDKAKTAFADTLGEQASDVDGCVHGLFSETGTETSRLSASKP